MSATVLLIHTLLNFFSLTQNNNIHLQSYAEIVFFMASHSNIKPYIYCQPEIFQSKIIILKIY